MQVVATCRGASASEDVLIHGGQITWTQTPQSSANAVTGTQINLSALANANFAPESEIIYTWKVDSRSPAASFSVNNSNAAKSTIATVSNANSYYLFSCTATCRAEENSFVSTYRLSRFPRSFNRSPWSCSPS